MRRTTYFCTTLREAPADVEAPGHQWLLRGGFVQPLAAGIYTLLPLGQRVSEKLKAIMREEMDAVGGQELSMPVVHPAELWQATGRWSLIGPELVRMKDRADRDMVLAFTHEEVVADLLRRNIRSYKQLPVVLYHFQTKFRDEPRPRGGLLRTREFVMKDAYSCHADSDDLDRVYGEMYQAYFNVFRRSGIEVIAVLSDVGVMGGTMAHEFMHLSPVGEDRLLICRSCGYQANREVATFRKDAPPHEDPKPVDEVATPDTPTIAALAAFLGIPETRTAKATFFMAGDRLVFAVVRGDMEVNEVKLMNAVGATDLRPAQPEDLEGSGIVAGYASPIGISGATVVVDDLVAATPNLVAGANRPGFHLWNTNAGRDYEADVVADITAAFEGAPCPQCGEPLEIARGIEVGNIFKLGTRFTRALGATFLDEEGGARDFLMASYGIGVGRLMATIAEACNDEKGLTWPATVAPFDVYLVALDLEDAAVMAAAETLYGTLQERGLEVLFDDRKERAGVKFNDADLLGMPLRVTVSRRTMQRDCAEIKPRAGGEAHDAPLTEAAADIEGALTEMRRRVLRGRDTPA